VSEEEQASAAIVVISNIFFIMDPESGENKVLNN